VQRYFRDKELPGIMKISESIKESVEEFKPQVPILIALRTDGI
jgi:dynein heavy chain